MFDSMGEYALRYARHGWAVHALKPREKTPATPHGWKDASTNEDTVRAMWSDQSCNIGIATGHASGVFVFDVDATAPKDGGMTGPEALAALVETHGPLPATLRARTGSGAHYYFRMPSGVELANRARITVRGQRTGLDVRADGGYVVAPPSIHPNGSAYVWEQGAREVADAPPWLVELVRKESPKATAPMSAPVVASTSPSDDDASTAAQVLEHACESIRTCQGSRHDEIYRQAARVGQLVGGGCILRDAAEFELVSAGLAAGKAETEVRRTVRDGLDRGAQSPRRPSDSPMTIPPSSYRPSDVGNAARLAERFGGDVRWCGSAQGEGFLCWDGARWAPDTMRRVDHMTRDVARDVVDYALDLETRLRTAAQATGGKPTPSQQAALNALREEVKTWRKWARDSEMVAHLRASLTTARVDVAVAHEALDSDPWSLNTRTGTVDLRTGEQRPHRREDMHTKVAGAGVGAVACPVWVSFLTRIMGGDAEMVAFIQRVVGYCLTGSTREQCLFILYGNGSNGKSTFLDTIRTVFGDYAQHARAETFVRDRKGGGIPNDVAALRGARLVTASEPEQGAQLDESLIKEMTGDAAISARFMRQEFFTFTPQFKVLLATNHRPVIRGTDHGIWRRIRLVPFLETIREDEKDRDLGKKLEAEADAILAWGIEGARLWSLHGLQEPSAVREATDDYRADMDVLADFLAEKCSLHGVSTNTELYKAFMEWQQANGEKPRSQKWLTRALFDRGYKQDPTRKYGRRWVGLSLLEVPGAHIREVTRW